jgi:thiol-disulfide isomerase/thioredoxin
MNKSKILLFAVFAALFTGIGLYVGMQRIQPAPPENAAVAALMRSRLPDADNKPRDFSEWKGKTLLINFWATWCPPCVAEMPELVELQTEMAPQNLQIVGIGIDSPTNIRQFAEKFQISYPLLIAGMEGTELSRQFGNQGGGLPFTVLIGRDGRVRQTYIGRLDMKKVRADLASL